eukprot:5992532-Amphidinium_carterae.1
MFFSKNVCSVLGETFGSFCESAFTEHHLRPDTGWGGRLLSKRELAFGEISGRWELSYVCLEKGRGVAADGIEGKYEDELECQGDECGRERWQGRIGSTTLPEDIAVIGDRSAELRAFQGDK